eukprot:5793155-Pleurochrysis_carterae.AAC.1
MRTRTSTRSWRCQEAESLRCERWKRKRDCARASALGLDNGAQGWLEGGAGGNVKGRRDGWRKVRLAWLRTGVGLGAGPVDGAHERGVRPKQGSRAYGQGQTGFCAWRGATEEGGIKR